MAEDPPKGVCPQLSGIDIEVSVNPAARKLEEAEWQHLPPGSPRIGFLFEVQQTPLNHL